VNEGTILFVTKSKILITIIKALKAKLRRGGDISF